MVKSLQLSIDKSMRSKITDWLAKVEKFSSCADLWSRENFKSSFLGITAHFFDSESGKVEVLLLDLVLLDDRILAAMEKCLSEYRFSGINDPALFRIVTDSKVLEALNEENYAAAEEFGLEAEEIEEKEPVECRKRLPCFDHMLNNIQKNCLEKNEEVVGLLDLIRKLVRAVHSSAKASEFLATNGEGLQLITPCKTRWVYNLFVLDQLLKLEQQIRHMAATICKSLRLPDG